MKVQQASINGKKKDLANIRYMQSNEKKEQTKKGELKKGEQNK